MTCRICTSLARKKGEEATPKNHDPQRLHTDTAVTEAKRLEALAELRKATP